VPVRGKGRGLRCTTINHELGSQTGHAASLSTSTSPSQHAIESTQVDRNGDAHEPHIHPNTAIAAVYYVAAGAARACAIDLYDPRIAAEYFDPGIRLAAEGDRMRLHCAPGELLLFPGWVRHGVPRYDDGGIRVSMSWNLYFAVQANS